ncbi:MAG TPA: spore maturation protein A, partial [Clostridiales bacterium]|nr:spore maturation protein A [Clostridiales bacterium]
MMKWIFTGLIAASLVFGWGLGRMDAVSNAAITECGSAIQLAITLAGSMCLWSGMMGIAQKAGLTEGLSRLFAPMVRVLFKGLSPDSPAA